MNKVKQSFVSREEPQVKDGLAMWNGVFRESLFWVLNDLFIHPSIIYVSGTVLDSWATSVTKRN